MKHIEDDKSFEITIGFITRMKYLKKAANKPCLECTKIRKSITGINVKPGWRAV